MWEKPDANEFLDFYKSHSTTETAKHYNTSESSIGRYARSLGFSKPREGAKHPYKKTLARLKNSDKIKDLWEKGYSVNQIARLCEMKRHEVESVMMLSGIPIEAKKITDLSEEARDEYLSNRRTLRFKKTGSPAFSLTEEHKKKLSEFRLASGYKEAHHEIYSNAQKKLVASGHRPFGDARAEKQSKLNLAWKELLEKNGLKVSSEAFAGGYWFDLSIENTFIEIDPTYTHNSTKGLYLRNGGTTAPKEKDYHLKKSLAAEREGKRCIHVWDWDDQEKIVSLLSNKSPIGARNLILGTPSIKELRVFLEENHLQGFCLGQSIRLGLYLNNSLVQVMTFGKSRYNTFEYELLRLCSDKRYRVIGGVEKLFSYFVKTFNPTSIISYCDRSKFSGSVYGKLGFTSTGRNIMKHWSKGSHHFTDAYIQSVGPDRAIGTSYGKGIDNSSIMLSEGFLEVYDAGQEKFIWKRDCN